MKKFFNVSVLFLFSALFLTACSDAGVPEWIVSIGAWLAPLLTGFVEKAPVLMTVLMVIGILRAIMKPLIALLRAYVASTPNPNDDKVLDEVEKSTAMKVVFFVLDWFGSIKPLKD